MARLFGLAETADALVRLAFAEGPSGDAELLAEADRMIRGYLADRLSS